MFTLSRYVLKAHIAPAVAGLAIFYFVLSMDFIVDYLNLFIAKGVPGLAVLEGFVLSLAWMTVMAVPMAVMVSVLTAFGRLAGDNEVTAVKASGMNVFTLIAPVLLASALIAGGVFWFGNHVLPAANYRLKVLLVDIHKIRPLATIEPGVLTDLPGGYTIIVDRLDPATSDVFGVRIHKLEGDEPLQTIVAERGHVTTEQSGGRMSLELFNGEILEADPNDPTRFNRLLFDRHVINIEESKSELGQTAGVRRGDRELSIAELSQNISERMLEIDASRAKLNHAIESRSAVEDTMGGPAPGQNSDTRTRLARLDRTIEAETRNLDNDLGDIRKLRVEYQKKMSIPFACIVFVLLGAPLGIRSRRGGIGIGAGTGTLFFLIYYLFLVGGEQLGDRGIVSPFWAMWAPNIIFGGLGIYLTTAVSREWRVAPLTRVIDFVLRPPQRAAKGQEKK